MGTANEVNGPVVFFDGVCNLCNGAVNFAIDHDSNKKFKFAPLQSQFAREKIPASLQGVDSIVLLIEGDLFVKSDAALRIARNLDGYVRLLWYFRFVPMSIRDWVYDRVAASRYRIFGKQDTCRIPTPELLERFISSPIVS